MKELNVGDTVECIDECNLYYEKKFTIEGISDDLSFFPYRCVSDELLPYDNPIFFMASSISPSTPNL